MPKPTCTIGFAVEDLHRSGHMHWKACCKPAVRYFIYLNEHATRRLAAVCQEHEPKGMDLTGYREISYEEFLVAQVMHA